jgi:hypothetical protein
MNINRENYEAFFLDHFEGNLTKSQETELMDFLQQNNDLKDEFESFEMLSLDNEIQQSFSGKEFLKRPFDTTIKDTVKEIHLIAWHEGDLNESEKKMVTQAVAEDINFQKDFNLFGLTKLLPDTSIIYQDKKSLKRYVIGSYTHTLLKFAAAAAILGFVATIYFMAPRLTNETQVAVVIPENITSDNIPATPTDELKPISNEDILPESSPKIQIAKADIKSTTPSITSVGMSSYLARIEPRGQINISIQKNEPMFIDSKEEFYWHSYADGMEYEEDDILDDSHPVASPPRQYTSLASLAYSGIERTTGIDLQGFEKKVSETRMGLWDLAGLGLAGIGNLTGTPLTIDKERDENGRIRTFGIGERFKISR